MSELLPQFRIQAPLRCDGIGRLDCAEDTQSGERLAVRWVPLDANGAEAVKAVEQLPQHPTLPRIRQTGQVGASAFVALDFPQGETLAARGTVTADELLAVARQLSAALSALHAQGVVHGELCLDSVLLADDARAVLWDLPLLLTSRLADRRGESRLMQNLVRTAPFLAPERARGEAPAAPGDVYALGALLCVAGGAQLPKTTSTLELVYRVATRAFVPEIPQSLPQVLRESLTRMLTADVSARMTAEEVATALSPRLTTAPEHRTLPQFPAVEPLRDDEVTARRRALTPQLPVAQVTSDQHPVPQEMQDAADALVAQQLEALRAPTREVPALALLAKATAPHPFMRAALHAAHTPQPPTANSLGTEELADEWESVKSEAHAVETVRIPTVEFEAVRETIAPQVTFMVGEEDLVQEDDGSVEKKLWAVLGVLALGALALALVALLRAQPAPVLAAPALVPVVVKAPAAVELDDELLVPLAPAHAFHGNE